MILFGHDFRDSKTINSHSRLYSHPDLESSWTHGHVSIGSVTPSSINYVASYTQKKLTKLQNDRYFSRISGQIRDREFNLMSIRPAIGRTYYDKYKSTLDISNTVVIDGKEMAVPKYFNRISDKQFTDSIIFDENIIDNDEIETKISKSTKISRVEQRELKLKDIL